MLTKIPFSFNVLEQVYKKRWCERGVPGGLAFLKRTYTLLVKTKSKEWLSNGGISTIAALKLRDDR